jgi:GNAT superfamily N-acetyltransferase
VKHSISMSEVIEENLAEYQVAMGHCLGASIVKDAQGLSVATDAPFPMYNGVFRSNFSESTAAANIHSIQEQFGQRNVPMVWMLGPSSKPHNLAEHLLASGFRHYEDEPGMYLDLDIMSKDAPVPDGFQLRVVQSDDELKAWVSVWAFDTQEIVPQLFDIHRQFRYDDTAPWRYYLGMRHGVPVATSLLFRGKTSAAVHWVVTIPEARHQGIGAVMTLAALHDARAEGYQHAILTASPQGEGIYRRIGFESCCTISKYTWKP